MIKPTIAMLTAIVIIVMVNMSVYKKEQILAEGQLVLLELAPVDPRSLMQGDYMALDYDIAQQIRSHYREQEQWDEQAIDGFVIVELDEQQRAHFIGLEQGLPLTGTQVRLQYRIRNGRIKFASNAYFFEEGSAEKYQDAAYGAFKVAHNGEILLSHLVSNELEVLR